MTHHLHSTQHSNRITLLHLQAILNTDLDNNAAHRCANLVGIGRIGLDTADVVHSGIDVVNANLAHFTVHLVKHLALASLLGQRSDGKELENKYLALLQLDGELLANVRAGEEELGGKHGEIAVLGDELPVFLKHLGVHGVRGNVALGGTAPLGLDVGLDLGQVKRSEVQAGTGVEPAAVAESAGAEGFGEAAVGLAHETLEELEDGAGEVELSGTGNDIVGGQLVGDHELSKITNDLGGWSDLDDITEEVVGLLVRLLGRRPLGSETKLVGLEDEVGELATGDLVLVDLGVGASEASLKRRVEHTELRPVRVDGADVADVELGILVGALERSEDGTNAGLRGHARQAVSGSVDGIGASFGASSHGGDAGTGRVVGVDVDGQVGMALANGTDKNGGGPRLQHTSHILDTENVRANLDDLVNEAEVVVEVVLLAGVQHVTAVADGTFDDTTGSHDSLHTDLELVDVVQGVKDTEDIDTILLGLLTEVVDGVIREACRC